MKNKIISSLVFIIAINVVLNAQGISERQLRKNINYLASDKLKGRGTGTADEEKAAVYIANEFRKLKLVPSGNYESYFQFFTFKHNPNPHDTVTSQIVERKARNVVGFLNNGAAETIVIGAHYDHLGLGLDHNSLDANPENKIHNGADDNASGTAGVIEIARYFSTNAIKEKYNFLFLCFSAEELGLIGSKRFLEEPLFNSKTFNYMINMDMIGRLSDSTKKLLIYGVGTSPTWVPLIDKTNTYFSIKKDSSGIGPSDQTSFYLKDIPVLHFFTGQHSDYHKPTDDANKINYKGEVKVLEFIVKIIEQTLETPRLVFAKTKNSEGEKISFKVTLGIMPDYAYEGRGVRADGVTDGKPAGKAGLQKGDVIIELNKMEIKNMQDYMKALNTIKKGTTTTVKIIRDAKELEKAISF